jgi:hypothetical protein
LRTLGPVRGRKKPFRKTVGRMVTTGRPDHAERPGQHGDEPAELVAKKVLHQRARFAHA